MNHPLYILVQVLLNVIAGTVIGKVSGLVLKNAKPKEHKTNFIKLIVSLFTIVVMYTLYNVVAKRVNITLTNESKLIMAWIVFTTNIHITNMFRDMMNVIPPRL